MERNRNGQPNDRKVGWLPEIDRLLLVGMKHGPKGIREVKKRLKQLAPGLTPGEIWKRMRHLRENSSDGRDPRQWPPEIIQLLKDGYQYGGSRKKEALNILREQYPGVPELCHIAVCSPAGLVAKVYQGTNWENPPTMDPSRRGTTAATSGLRFTPANCSQATPDRKGDSVLTAQGLSGSVKDGVSLRAFRQMFHIHHRKTTVLIADGILRVRDSRISAKSLAQFCTKHEGSLEAADVNRGQGGVSEAGCRILLGPGSEPAGHINRSSTHARGEKAPEGR